MNKEKKAIVHGLLNKYPLLKHVVYNIKEKNINQKNMYIDDFLNGEK